MCTFSEELKDRVWDSAIIVEGYDPAIYRQDCCGAWIKKDKYNDRDSDFGWEIDHIYPKALLRDKGADKEEIDNEENLRAMKWRNNLSKGLDYPVYHISVRAEGAKNVSADEEFEVNKDLQGVIKRLYSKYL